MQFDEHFPFLTYKIIPPSFFPYSLEKIKGKNNKRGLAPFRENPSYVVHFPQGSQEES